MAESPRSLASTAPTTGDGLHRAARAAPPPSDSLRQRFIRRFRRHRLAMIGLTALLIMLLMGVLAPIVAGQDPNADNLRLIRKPPQEGHLLGTDGVGRDIWARLVYGTRVSLSVGLVAVTLASLIGITIGSIAGYYGGQIDNLLMRFTDIIMCFPTFLIILTVVAIVSPSIINVMAVIGLFGWTGMARLVRGQFLSLREQDFVTAARAMGASGGRIIRYHLLPNVVAPMSVAATLSLASAILTESGLSFLGLGVQIPEASWGNMLYGAMTISIIEDNWWLWLPPGVMIMIAVLAINFVGDGLRDALDPRMSLD